MGTTFCREQRMSGGPGLSIAASSVDDGIEWTTIHITTPGEYWLAYPTPDQAEELARTRPRGKLKSVGGSLLWIEPRGPSVLHDLPTDEARPGLLF